MYRTIRPIKQDVVHSHARKIYKIVVYCVATYIQINTKSSYMLIFTLLVIVLSYMTAK